MRNLIIFKGIMYRGSCIISSLIITICLLPLDAKGQTPGFVQQDIIKKPGIYSDTDIPALATADRRVIRMYYDGLGQQLQSISVKSTPTGNDVVQPYAFNSLGQQTMGYLPYVATGSTGTYRPNALTSEQSSFYSNGLNDKVADDPNPYLQVFYADDPSQRLFNSGKVGNNYQVGQHRRLTAYRSNNSGDGNIIIWSATGTNTGYYATGSLSVTEQTDEEQVKVVSFTDNGGNIILKREYTGTAAVYQDTYYVYNLAGMISYVIPPKATDLMVASGNYNLTQTVIAKLIYQYWYDGLGRTSQKQIPGTGLVSMIYDPLNRPVLVQNAKLASSFKWNYIKYDQKGHAISSGIYTDPNSYSPSAMQNAVDNNSIYNTYWYETRNTASSTGYYTNNTFPNTNITPMSYVYFDNYDMDLSGTDDFTYSSQWGTDQATTSTLKGMPTMTRKTTVGNGVTAGTWLLTYTFYDKYGHMIQVKSNNQLTSAVSDIKTTTYDFAGAPTQNKVVKVVAGNTTTVLSTMGYDPMRRLISIDQSYNGAAAIRIASYVYNELGQLVKKNLGLVNNGTIPQTLDLKTTYSGTNTFVASQSISLSENFDVPAGSTFSASIQTNYLQSVDYRYNIRGQLISINNSKLSLDDGSGSGYTNSDSNDLFGMQFLYDNADANVGNTAYFNGRLSAVKWMSKDNNGLSSTERSYKYTYDALDRYKGASYAERATASTGSFGGNVGGFDESVGLYDSNGNIQSLVRKNSTPGGSSVSTIDNLTYIYDPNNANQLYKMTDGSGSSAGFNYGSATTASIYQYDAVGNLTADPYKGLGISYNDLNKTNVITVTAGTNQHVDYTYDASGTVIRKQLYYNTNPVVTTDYIDGFVYIGSSLSYFPMPEGRVRNTGSSLKPEYIITDQQGNARISFEESTTAGVPVVRQENSYYGMGMAMTSTMVLPTSPNKNLYNGGSEWQNDYSNAPDYYQTLNRNYDAALGRFISVDPMAEATESMSVYQYANNNPVMMNDPEGNYAAPPAGTSQGYWTASFGISAITSLSQVHDLFNQRLYGGAIDDINYNLMKAFFVGGGTGGGDRSFGWVTTSDGAQMRLAWKQFAAANGISDDTPIDFKGNSTSFYVTWDTPAEGEIGVVGHKKRFTMDDQGGLQIPTIDQLQNQTYVPAGGTTPYSWTELGGQINALVAVVAPFIKGTVEYMRAGSYGLGKFYASAWRGGSSALIKTVEVSKALGAAGFVAGEIMDIVNLANGNISWRHAGVNLAMGILGFTEAAPLSVGYFLFDAFYKGGIPGALKDYGHYTGMDKMSDPDTYKYMYGNPNKKYNDN